MKTTSFTFSYNICSSEIIKKKKEVVSSGFVSSTFTYIYSLVKSLETKIDAACWTYIRNLCYLQNVCLSPPQSALLLYNLKSLFVWFRPQYLEVQFCSITITLVMNCAPSLPSAMGIEIDGPWFIHAIFRLYPKPRCRHELEGVLFSMCLTGRMIVTSVWCKFSLVVERNKSYWKYDIETIFRFTQRYNKLRKEALYVSRCSYKLTF